MLTDAELESLLLNRESSRVERKESLVLDAAKETACAFANDISNSGLPGVIFVGVRDDGTCAGLTIDDGLLRRGGEILKINVRTEVDITSASLEVRTSDYPVGALQQLARNAIMHRNYQSNAPTRIYWFTDRVEVHNPGGLYGQVNPDNFGLATDYRNPLVAEGMRNYGFVQKFGVGIATARKLLMENGNPPPEFQFSEVLFATIVRRR